MKRQLGEKIDELPECEKRTGVTPALYSEMDGDDGMAFTVMEADARCDLRRRTTEYALRIVRMFCALPKTTEAQVLGRQVLKSGTSVGAHYREATRARSLAEFVSKIEGAQQELEETCYWLELLDRSGVVAEGKLAELQQETNELAAILAASAITAKKRQNSHRIK